MTEEELLRLEARAYWTPEDTVRLIAALREEREARGRAEEELREMRSGSNFPPFESSASQGRER